MDKISFDLDKTYSMNMEQLVYEMIRTKAYVATILETLSKDLNEEDQRIIDEKVKSNTEIFMKNFLETADKLGSLEEGE